MSGRSAGIAPTWAGAVPIAAAAPPGHDDPMGTVLSTIVIDSLDTRRLAAWWSLVLERSLAADDGDEIALPPEGGVGPEILFVPVTESKTVKNRLHLDLRPQNGSDQATELQRLLDLGARRVDVVFGGPPCQGFSMIGQRVLDDPRNALVQEFVRIVRELDRYQGLSGGARGTEARRKLLKSLDSGAETDPSSAREDESAEYDSSDA